MTFSNVIEENNYYQEIDTYFTKRATSGQKINLKEFKYFLNIIKIKKAYNLV